MYTTLEMLMECMGAEQVSSQGTSLGGCGRLERSWARGTSGRSLAGDVQLRLIHMWVRMQLHAWQFMAPPCLFTLAVRANGGQGWLAENRPSTVCQCPQPRQA